jgi:methionine sulfoxide reductase heme-binding subunit
VTVSAIGAVAGASNWYWYFGRATGVIALVLLTATIVLGVLGPLRVSTTAWPRFAIRTLHRDLALLSLLIIAIHVVTVVLDGFVHIPLSAAVLPFGSSYRAFWVALGAIAFDLLLAVVLTSLLRRRVGDRIWRFVHWFTYASWPIAVAHGLGAGSDSGQAWALAITVGCCAVVAIAASLRILRARPSSSRDARGGALPDPRPRRRPPEPARSTR